MTHQFSPEFGRASGGVLNLVTERGTNQNSRRSGSSRGRRGR